MIVISIVHTKGGVGKTTSAMYLALAAVEAGFSVAVLDADPQRSALQWIEDTEGGMPFPVFESDSQLSQLSSLAKYELVFIDTPPGAAGVIQRAVNAADLVLVPCGASPLDVRRVWPTMQVASKKNPVVLLTSVSLSARLGLEVRGVLNEAGVTVLKTPIIRRERVRREYGTVPTYLNGYDDVLRELVTVDG